jgi:hypothetical protein
MNLKPRSACLVTATIALGVLIPASAHADTPSDSDSIAALQALTDRENGAAAVLDNVADVGDPRSADAAIDGTVNGVDVTVPNDASEAIVLDEASITLPTNAGTGEGAATGGVVDYRGPDGAHSVVVAKEDGSVQVATVIDEETAPVRYAYEISLPAGASWTETDSGALLAVDADGALVLGVAPAWAKDANGADVPTRYVLDGGTLTQIVDHQGAGYQYPIVADPWLGASIFQETQWHPAIPKAVAIISVWGALIQSGGAQGGGAAGWLAGQTILNEAGWSEFSNKVPAVKKKATYRQQFACHVKGAYTPITGGTSWDLEGWRSNNPNWNNGAAYHKCNW